MGMVEQFLFGVVLGIVVEGFIFFVMIYVVFVVCCVYDFIYQMIVEEDCNVKIVCVLFGFIFGYGLSYQVVEDVVLFCVMLNMIIIDLCDVCEIEQVVLVMVSY